MKFFKKSLNDQFERFDRRSCYHQQQNDLKIRIMKFKNLEKKNYLSFVFEKNNLR